MFDEFDNTVNSAFGKRSNYSSEEIDEALKRQKKNGGSLMENLQAISGKSMPTLDTRALLKENERILKQMESIGNPMQVNLDYHQSLQKDLDDLTKNIQSDFGTMETMKAENKTFEKEGKLPEAEPEMNIESFKGIEDVINAKVIGQEAFVKKLLIAFKRPLVMPEKEGYPKNSIFITGPEDTGKHESLTALAAELKNRKLWKSDEISIIDLSIYHAAGMDKVFLQDLYSALRSDAKIVLFENFENCHSSYLTYLSALVTEGKCRLSERYVMQKGQLVGVTNALASDTVSTFNAAGKYIVIISTKGLDKLAGSMGAPFINALGDVCETKSLDRENYIEFSNRCYDALVKQVAEKLFFKLEADKEAFVENSIVYTEKGRGLAGLMHYYEDVFKALAQMKLEGDYERDELLKLEICDGATIAVIGEERTDLIASLGGGYTGEIDKIKAEMDDIVGLKEVKEYIFSLEEYFSVQKKRREQGLKAGEVNKHMIFTGNPGTGKTTIARIISKYLKAIGVLTGGQLIEVSRADLVGRYVGHTAPLTNQVIQSAIGGVLFIDEAYSLYRGKDDTFGLEAIDTLVKGIEDNRDNLIVILAGYSIEMEEFLTANSGLKSRFPNIINFPDYTGEELLEISKITAKSKGYVIDDEALDGLLTYYNMVQMTRAMDAGNGRLVRNKIEDAILNQSRRLVAEPDADLSLLKLMDFELDDVNG
ncbi:MAG: AAA family ATPase [Lachnospiraceae bacterium]|nr:AAA family ATPase [Lachnospiraceae bacterium]